MTRLVTVLLLLSPLAAAHKWLREKAPSMTSDQDLYTKAQARAFVGAQHWWESGFYADKGLSEHYDGYFCLCACSATPEGVFCKGNGVQPSGQKVADFLGVFSESFGGESWEGNLVAYGTDTPFADKFSFQAPGSAANYTGVSQSLDEQSFVWRGRMSGVDCGAKDHCVEACGGEDAFREWYDACP